MGGCGGAEFGLPNSAPNRPPAPKIGFLGVGFLGQSENSNRAGGALGAEFANLSSSNTTCLTNLDSQTQRLIGLQRKKFSIGLGGELGPNFLGQKS